ncbi:Alpha/Beta hydrolase protein [Xylogone sp. PMI_703]|nr:Alpha/Beta hydrolase protein [Xylogone sp. PMI_703]
MLITAVTAVTAAASALPSVNCRVVTFSVTASAQNEDFGNDFDPNNATSINQFVNQALNIGSVEIDGTVQVKQSFSISAQYCIPSIAAANTDSIQVLLHGNTCNRKIWDGLGLSSLQDAGYSYQRAAAAAGHTTLALDMIGHGASTLSDPNTVDQMPIEASIVNQITTSLRLQSNPLGQAFNQIVFVGHSYGSITGIAAARVFPNFADAMVLTGWSSSLPLPSPLLSIELQPAQSVEQRFAELPLGYLTASNETGSINTFFGGKFDQSVAEANFKLQDVMTTGEGGSIGEGFQPASEFTGSVLVVTGADDILFCNPASGACANQLADSKALVPNATLFDTYAIPETGHDFTLHLSSQATFKFIQNWLDENLK